METTQILESTSIHNLLNRKVFLLLISTEEAMDPKNTVEVI